MKQKILMFLYIIFMLLIISPLDFLPASDFDDSFYGIVDLILSFLIWYSRKPKGEIEEK